MRHQLFFLLLFIGLTAAVSADEPSNWTLYRFDSHANAAPENVKVPDRLKLCWKIQLETDWAEATPVIANGVLYAGSTDAGLRAFSMADGKPLWVFPIESGMLIPPSFYSLDKNNSLVFAGSTDGTLFAVDASTGKQRWSFQTKGTLYNAPNIDAKTNRILLTSEDGSLYSIDILSGKLEWEYKAEDQLRCFPAISGRVCFVSGCDSHLHVVDLDTGKCVSKIDIGAPSGSTPVVLDNFADNTDTSRVFFGTEGNEFIAVDWNSRTKEAKIAWREPLKQALRSPAACKNGDLVYEYRKVRYSTEWTTVEHTIGYEWHRD
ncbi:hypothetical protein FACS1894214_3210 [Planctomycetales bacterium]|nr:hypothetical protein FACS1894214_3210 [Planctomycetales bacterium]